MEIERARMACVAAALRGAPGVGQSTAARRLVELLGTEAAVEVGRLTVIPADRYRRDGSKHAAAFAVGVRAAASFIEARVALIEIVETFGRDGVARAREAISKTSLQMRSVSRWAFHAVLARRLDSRPAGCADEQRGRLINDETMRVRLDDVLLTETARIDPDAVVAQVLGIVPMGSPDGPWFVGADEGRPGPSQ